MVIFSVLILSGPLTIRCVPIFLNAVFLFQKMFKPRDSLSFGLYIQTFGSIQGSISNKQLSVHVVRARRCEKMKTLIIVIMTAASIGLLQYVGCINVSRPGQASVTRPSECSDRCQERCIFVGVQ